MAAVAWQRSFVRGLHLTMKEAMGGRACPTGAARRKSLRATEGAAELSETTERFVHAV